MLYWFNKTHDRKRFRIFPALASGRNHCRPGNPLECRIGNALTKCLYQTGAEQVAGCLASNQADFHNRLADDATLGGAQRLEENIKLRLFFRESSDFVDRRIEFLALPINNPVGILDIANLISAEVATLQSL